MDLYDPSDLNLTKYLFFTGKGGVGKTSVACATAMNMADRGQKVMLVSTDPASNLQDVFQMELTNKPTPITGIPNLSVANFDPVTAAAEYREGIVGPYRGVLPDSAIENMEEQLSGSCTVEIASFNEFANFLTDQTIEENYDHIIFDTAPTGHTLRMLQLPSAWNDYLDENTTGVSCLGQLSGLGDKKQMYEHAVETLNDGKTTTIVIVSRPQRASLIESKRAYTELEKLNIDHHILIINGILEEADDDVSQEIFHQQQYDLKNIPEILHHLKTFYVPLRPYNVMGVKNIRTLLNQQQPKVAPMPAEKLDFKNLQDIVDDYIKTNKKIIFTMGKGGVGKTAVAIKIAKKFVAAGKKVRLATTDPADHIDLYLPDKTGITVSHIDEQKELADYQNEVISKARKSMDDDNLDYVKEDLRSPCTQEIAVFRAFARIVDQSQDEIVVIDTAPTGHTLLLLESTQNYAHEVQRSSGEVPESIQKLLPRLQDQQQTEVLTVTLPETTPIYESVRLNQDLDRAKIAHTWWLVNQSMYATQTTNDILSVRASEELEWIEKVADISQGNYAVEQWVPDFEQNMVH
ncbi:arsenical pump-driving ATPase [Companilactobacillus zhongbaensis]|uniref:arsenical pump-driving ATPase n=1 Tax=Companilactobacillus zhongbaensis TaxID=2486009 RepID=UPI000F776E92|nr:arsenical pump-driving ATPase [Companilactobacillus zhongbaensis]